MRRDQTPSEARLRAMVKHLLKSFHEHTEDYFRLYGWVQRNLSGDQYENFCRILKEIGNGG